MSPPLRWPCAFVVVLACACSRGREPGEDEAKKAGAGPEAKDAAQTPAVTLSQEARQSAGIKVVAAAGQEFQPRLDAPGVIRPDAQRSVDVGAPLATLTGPDVTAAVARQRTAAVKADAARRALERADRLLALQAISRAERETRAADSEAAAAEAAAARQDLRALGIQGAVPSASAEVDSPVSGIVLEKSASAGLQVEKDAVLFQVADVSVVWAVADVYEKDLGEVARGGEAEVRTDAYPEMGPPSTGLGEVFHFLVEAEWLSPMERRTLLDWDIAYRLRSVPGIVEVNTVGGLVKQYHILVSPNRLLAHRLTLPQVFEAVEKDNVIQGGGIRERGGEAYLVRGEGMASGPSDLARIVVGTTPEGRPVVVHQVGRVQEGPMLRIGGVTRDGRGEGVVGTTMMLAGANAREVVGRVKQELEEMAPSLPPGVRVVPFYDRQALVSRVIKTVSHNLIEGGLLVIAVLLLILGHLRGGLIVALAIPLSMLFAFLGMVAAGITGNLMSLGAIDFGLIVDGSVVMVENIVFRLASRPGLDAAQRREEVARAAQEVGRPVAFGVGIILIVYLPILTLGGIEGKMFRPMALTVVFAVAGSLLLALTLIPVLCSLAFGGAVREKETWLLRQAHRLHQPLLGRAMKHPGLTAAIAGAVFALSLGAAALLGAEFIPELDEGDLLLRVSRLPSAALSEALRSTTQVEKVLHRFPEVNTAVSRTGSPELATEPEGFENSEVFINLKPRKEWKHEREELIDEMKTALERTIPGQIFSFSQPIEDRFEDLVAGVKSDVGIKVFGEDLAILGTKAQEIAGIVSQVDGAADTRVEQTAGLPMLRVRVDRDRLARFGVSAADALAAVEAARSGRVVGNVIEGKRRFDVVVRLDESVAADLNSLGSVPVLAADGRPVPLSQVAEITIEEAPSRISREQGERRVVVEANVRGRDLAGFVSEARRAVEARVKLPSGYYLRWSGQFEHLAAATQRLLIAVPAALLLIFSLLYGAFGSVRAALLIFLNVPVAATGGIFALLLRGMPFSISAGVGFIALFGVAVLNGVVLVSFIRRLETEGTPPGEAAERAAQARLRPVLMTALVASLGFVPMAIATGSGAEVQKPLATVVIGGLVTATMLTLVVLPAVYRWFTPRQEGRT